MNARWLWSGALVIGLLAGGGSAMATQEDDQVITACVSTSNGAVRVTGDACRTNESPLTWNKVGPQGPEGPAGEDGVDGIDGIDGEDGVDGIDGEDGEDAFLATHSVTGPGQVNLDSTWQMIGTTVNADPGQRVSMSASAIVQAAGDADKTVNVAICSRDFGSSSASPVDSASQGVLLRPFAFDSVSVHSTAVATESLDEFGVCASSPNEGTGAGSVHGYAMITAN